MESPEPLVQNIFTELFLMMPSTTIAQIGLMVSEKDFLILELLIPDMASLNPRGSIGRIQDSGPLDISCGSHGFRDFF